MSPVTAMPNNQATYKKTSDMIWSPFSTQIFSPYDTTKNNANTTSTASSFQYSRSNCYSKSNESDNSFSKSFNGTSMGNFFIF